MGSASEQPARERNGIIVARTEIMGLNPFRQQKRRPSDYVFVAAAFVVVGLLLLWVLYPR